MTCGNSEIGICRMPRDKAGSNRTTGDKAGCHGIIGNKQGTAGTPGSEQSVAGDTWVWAGCSQDTWSASKVALSGPDARRMGRLFFAPRLAPGPLLSFPSIIPSMGLALAGGSTSLSGFLGTKLISLRGSISGLSMNH